MTQRRGSRVCGNVRGRCGSPPDWRTTAWLPSGIALKPAYGIVVFTRQGGRHVEFVVKRTNGKPDDTGGIGAIGQYQPFAWSPTEYRLAVNGTAWVSAQPGADSDGNRG